MLAIGTSLVGHAAAFAGRDASSPTSNGGSRIIGVPSGRCLDVTGGSTSPGTRVQLYNCLGDPQQAWVWSGGRMEVYGNAPLCLDANSNDGGANGTPIQVWTCNGGANQQWVAESDGSLRSAAYGKCLDAIGGGQANGTQLQLWNCLGDPQQDWVGPPIPNGGGPVKQLAGGRCLDVTGAGISPGARPQLYDCLGDAQQQWLLDGRPLKVYDDKCLDAVNDGTSPGTPVQISYCSGAPQQQWSWGSDGTIRSLPSGLCLDSVYGGTVNGTPLQLSTCSGAASQSWSRGSAATTPAPAPAPAAPVSTTPASTPLPVPAAARALKVRMVLGWTWRGRTTWLQEARAGTMPGRTTISIRCAGRGCPRPRTRAVHGARAVRRLLRRLRGSRYRTGDVLSISLSAPGYAVERARILIRAGQKPRVR